MRFCPCTRLLQYPSPDPEQHPDSLYQVFMHHQRTGNKVGPYISGIIKNTADAIQLRLCTKWFTNKVSVNGTRCQRGRHIGWRQYNEGDVFLLHAVIFHEFMNNKILVAEQTGDGHLLSFQINQAPDLAVLCRLQFQNHRDDRGNRS